MRKRDGDLVPIPRRTSAKLAAATSWLSTAASSGIGRMPSDLYAGQLGSSHYLQRTVDLQDLEPIDVQGNPSKLWRQLRQPGKLSSSVALQVPQEAHIGDGCYGTVWLAKHRHSAREWYAVKHIIIPNGNPLLSARECQVAERIMESPHACVVRLFGVHAFDDSDLCSLIMEYCPSGDLGRRIQMFRALGAYRAPELSQAWVGHIFLGLEHVHGLGILLRDLKPENVVFDAEGLAKITDFGLGRFGLEAAGDWSFGMPAGTAGYVAPEVLEQQPYDQRADFYSLGVLMWVLLTGGMTNASWPMPPTDAGRFAGDFGPLKQDWQLLELCMSDPETSHARPVEDAVAKDLITKLTHKDSDDRLGVSQIRSHWYIASLNPPAADACHAEVRSWALAALK